MGATIKRIQGFFQNRKATLKNYLARLESQASTRFLTFCWAIFISFFGFTLLAGLNPVQLLIPGALFAPPAEDVRVPVDIHTFSQSGRSVSIKRFIHPDYQKEDRWLLMAHYISELPPPLEFPENIPDLLPMPHLALAIRKIWTRENGIIVDFRKSTVELEIEAFLKSHATKKKSAVLDHWFSSYTESLFQSGVERIDYLLDGKSESIDEMEFDLSKRYIRN